MRAAAAGSTERKLLLRCFPAMIHRNRGTCFYFRTWAPANILLAAHRARHGDVNHMTRT
jgi:hypothetical protein